MRKLIVEISLILAVAGTFIGVQSCNGFLNVVPDDGVPRIDMAFNLRSTAIRYLGTCYSFMPEDGYVAGDAAMLTGDELWDLVGRQVSLPYNGDNRVPNTYFQIARGFQSASKIIANDWASMYQGIRACDILVENIDNVPDMTYEEKEQWKAEATFLKAYYHFHLVRKWGPVPIIRESLPIDSDMETVRVYRDNIDTCFNFILRLLEQAYDNLPLTPESVDMYGRITKPICAALRAKVAVYAASPLFNGNDEEATLVDNLDRQLFPSKTDDEKLERWEYAVKACKDAIDACELANITLYDGKDIDITYRMTDSLKTTLTLRNAFNQRWNSEVIWANTQSSSSDMSSFQRWTMPNMTGNQHQQGGYRFIGVPMKIVDQFYTRNGLPINNDNDWESVNTQSLKEVPAMYNYYLEEGYTTVAQNFDREPRFYAFLGFDGGKWLGELSNLNDLSPEDVLSIQCRNGGHEGKSSGDTGPVTGYFPKKLYPISCNFTAFNSFTPYWFPWPIIRLSDIYLLYAEAINEAEGPRGEHSSDMFKYLNAIRDRAGIPDVKTAWDSYSNNPGYYNTQYGMRSIIRRERSIELAFESERYWDIRRWKEAPNEYQKGIYGYTVVGSAPEDYYVKKLIATQTFGIKDYFWPIYTYYLDRNPNLVQNLGW